MDNFERFMSELNSADWDDVDDFDYIEDYRPRKRRHHDDDDEEDADR